MHGKQDSASCMIFQIARARNLHDGTENKAVRRTDDEMENKVVQVARSSETTENKIARRQVRVTLLRACFPCRRKIAQLTRSCFS